MGANGWSPGFDFWVPEESLLLSFPRTGVPVEIWSDAFFFAEVACLRENEALFVPTPGGRSDALAVAEIAERAEPVSHNRSPGNWRVRGNPSHPSQKWVRISAFSIV